jgi:hypothetical protein
LTGDTRRQIAALIRQAGSTETFRLEIRPRAGRGVDGRQMAEQSEALRRYLATEYDLPIQQIDIAPLSTTGSAGPGEASLAIHAAPVVATVAPPDEVPAPDSSDGTVPDSVESGRALSGPAALVLLTAAAAILVVGVFALIRRRFEGKKRRRLIVREFERHLMDAPHV